MQHPYRPEIVVLKGEEAVEVLNKYVDELERTRPEEFSEAQAEAMKKLARGLISAIEEEATPRERPAHSRIATRLRRAVGSVLSQLLQEAENPMPDALQESSSYHPPPNHRPQ